MKLKFMELFMLFFFKQKRLFWMEFACSSHVLLFSLCALNPNALWAD